MRPRIGLAAAVLLFLALAPQASAEESRTIPGAGPSLALEVAGPGGLGPTTRSSASPRTAPAPSLSGTALATPST